MSTKSILKVVVAIGILALLLAFLGVNFVPRIFASSPAEKAVLDFSLLVRPNYVNEQYQRSIAPQLSYAGSDYYQRHASALAKSRGSVGSDYFERHAAELIKIQGTGGSEFLNHHPFAITQSLNSVVSDFLNHHPYDVSTQLKSDLSGKSDSLSSEYFSDSDYTVPGHKP